MFARVRVCACVYACVCVCVRRIATGTKISCDATLKPTMGKFIRIFIAGRRAAALSKLLSGLRKGRGIDRRRKGARGSARGTRIDAVH